jgi:hypothetical protein
MATGDFTLFEEFALAPLKEEWDLDSDAIKVGIIDNTSGEPPAATATPTWSDFVGDEVSGTGYTPDGETLTTTSWDEVDGVASLTADDVVISQNGAGFADGYWGIVYNSVTDAALGYVELGGPVGNVAGDLSIEWAGGVVYTHTVT